MTKQKNGRGETEKIKKKLRKGVKRDGEDKETEKWERRKGEYE